MSAHVRQSDITDKGAMVHLLEKAVHFDHTTSSNDRECIDLTLATKSNFWKSYNFFCHLYSFIKTVDLFLFVLALLANHCGI